MPTKNSQWQPDLPPRPTCAVTTNDWLQPRLGCRAGCHGVGRASALYQRRKVRARPSPSACSYATALSSNVATASASSSKALDGVQADLLVSAGGQNAEVRRNGAAATLHDERRREGQCSAVANDDRPCRKLPVVPVASRCLATRSPVAVSQASTKVSQGKGSDSRHLGQRIGRENDLRSNSLFQRHGACCPATTVLLSGDVA